LGHSAICSIGKAAYSFPSYSLSVWEGEPTPGGDDHVPPAGYAAEQRHDVQ
jgi:hypothetical protein